MESIFEKIYGAGQEALDLMKKPFVKRSLQRKFAAAYDDALNKEVESEKRISDHRAKFEDFDINAILEYKARIEKCQKLRDQIKDEFKIMFGEEMKVD